MEAFDGAATRYRKYLRGTKGRRRVDAEWEALRDHANGATVALDAGGGTGWLAHRLAQAGCHAVLLDRSSAMLRAAQAQKRLSHRPLLLLHADLAHPPVRAASIGLVACHHVLEYLPAWRPALRRISALVAPKGVLSLVMLRTGVEGDGACDRVFGLRRRGLRPNDIARALGPRFRITANTASDRYLHVVARREA